MLDSILDVSGRKKVSGPQLAIILDALAGAQDQALVARFPAVLALCARRGIDVDSHALFARYWESSPKRQNLEKLLLASSELFLQEGIPWPSNLAKLTDSIKKRHPELLAADFVQLSQGPCIAHADMQAALRQYTAGMRPTAGGAAAPAKQADRLLPLDRCLELLFSEKQTELISKRLEKRRLTKTEREYFSRVVKKKLAAIASGEMQDLALALIEPVRGRRGPQGSKKRPPAGG
jgi:hypothetical protein